MITELHLKLKNKRYCTSESRQCWVIMQHGAHRVVCVQELLEDGLLDQFHKSLMELNMDSAEELQSYINKLQLAVEQGRLKLLQSDGADGKMEVRVLLLNYWWQKESVFMFCLFESYFTLQVWTINEICIVIMVWRIDFLIRILLSFIITFWSFSSSRLADCIWKHISKKGFFLKLLLKT